VNSKGLQNRVQFLGKQERVHELLPVADLMIMPSELESFGLAALEAMVERTIGGRGAVVNVVGPPGIGKSRAAREAAALAAGARTADIAEAGAARLSTAQMGDAVLTALEKVAGKQKESA